MSHDLFIVNDNSNDVTVTQFSLSLNIFLTNFLKRRKFEKNNNVIAVSSKFSDVVVFPGRTGPFISTLDSSTCYFYTMIISILGKLNL